MRPTRVLVACSSAGKEGTKVIPAPMPTPAKATQTSQYIWEPRSGCALANVLCKCLLQVSFVLSEIHHTQYFHCPVCRSVRNCVDVLSYAVDQHLQGLASLQHQGGPTFKARLGLPVEEVLVQ